MKKFFALSLALVCVAGLSLGCKKPAEPAAPATTPAAEAPATDAAAEDAPAAEAPAADAAAEEAPAETPAE